MKNFSKTLISMAAVMAVGSAMAVSAMANDLSINKDALTSAGTITIDNVTPNKSQYTLLVVKGTADSEGAYTYDANSSTIKQVDQNDLGTPFSTIVLGTKQADNTYKLDEGSYKVLVGNNDGSLDSGIFTVSSTPQVVTKDIVIGDITGEGKVTAGDATALARYKAGLKGASYKNTAVEKKYKVEVAKDSFAVGSTVVIGDITGEGKVTAGDATALARYKAGLKGGTYKNTNVETSLTVSEITE
jgi:hypothetical protein